MLHHLVRRKKIFPNTKGDLTIRRQALNKCSLDECKAMLARNKEVERADAPGRTKEADAQMKGYVQAFQSVLQKSFLKEEIYRFLKEMICPFLKEETFPFLTEVMYSFLQEEIYPFLKEEI